MRRPSPYAGKTVVITGGGGGIGSALARRFAAAGAWVALLDLDGARARAVAVELEAEGVPALGIGCDITDPDATRAAFARIEDKLGPVDVLVNNAGTSHRSPATETRVGVLRKVMEVNYFGSVHCTEAALPSLIANRGQVIVVSSVAGFAPLLGRCGYAASKHALHGYFNTLRAELAPKGVNVLIVCPSYTATAFGPNALGGDGGKAAKPWTPTGGALQPEEVAAEVFRAAAGRKREVVLSAMGKAARWLAPMAPAVYDRVMSWNQRHELEPAR